MLENVIFDITVTVWKFGNRKKKNCMFRKIGTENETVEARAKRTFDLPVAPIDQQTVRAFRDEKKNIIYHVCLISTEETSPQTVRDQ